MSSADCIWLNLFGTAVGIENTYVQLNYLEK